MSDQDQAQLEEVPTPPPPLALTDQELKTIDEVIDGMAANMRKNQAYVVRPIFLNNNPGVCDQIDSILAIGLKELHKHQFDVAGEKLFDRLCCRERNGEDDSPKSMGHLAIRLMDSMKYILTIKKSYRGQGFDAGIKISEAKAELKKRKLL